MSVATSEMNVISQSTLRTGEPTTSWSWKKRAAAHFFFAFFLSRDLVERRAG
mgnify:CR=1 FL=1